MATQAVVVLPPDSSVAAAVAATAARVSLRPVTMAAMAGSVLYLQ
jgi:hypothetical protein